MSISRLGPAVTPLWRKLSNPLIVAWRDWDYNLDQPFCMLFTIRPLTFPLTLLLGGLDDARGNDV
jgi:hypothetical protein